MRAQLLLGVILSLEPADTSLEVEGQADQRQRHGEILSQVPAVTFRALLPLRQQTRRGQRTLSFPPMLIRLRGLIELMRRKNLFRK